MGKVQVLSLNPFTAEEENSPPPGGAEDEYTRPLVNAKMH